MGRLEIRNWRWLVIGLMVVGLLFSGGVIYAQSGGGFDLSWHTIDGGGQSSNGGYSLSGVSGQAEAGAASGGGYTLTGGFWGGAISGAIGNQQLFLPLILK